MKRFLIISALFLGSANVVLSVDDNLTQTKNNSIISKLEQTLVLLQKKYANNTNAQKLIAKIKALILAINENGLTEENIFATSQIYLDAAELVATIDAEVERQRYQDEREIERDRERNTEKAVQVLTAKQAKQANQEAGQAALSAAQKTNQKAPKIEESAAPKADTTVERFKKIMNNSLSKEEETYRNLDFFGSFGN